MNGIIVPTFPRDFHWTNKLLDSAGSEENVIVVFSSEQDYRDFGRTCNYLIVPPKPNHIESQATYKKLAALSQLHAQYEYLATIDTESKFIRATTPHLKTIWDNNCLVANESSHGSMIINTCLQDLNITQYPYDVNLYFWFNDIRVYPTSLIPSFLQWLSGHHIRMFSFDYMLFGIYMITQHNHKLRILDGKAHFSLVEGFGYQHEYRHMVNQVNWSTWFPHVENEPNVKMLFHLDRFPIK